MSTRHREIKHRQVKRGGVYWVNLGKKTGSVQAGKRLGVIILNDVGNKYSPTTIIAPLTTVYKKDKLPTHVQLETALPHPSMALLEQIVTVDKMDLLEYQTTLTNTDLKRVEKAIKVSMGVM